MILVEHPLFRMRKVDKIQRTSKIFIAKINVKPRSDVAIDVI